MENANDYKFWDYNFKSFARISSFDWQEMTTVIHLKLIVVLVLSIIL